MILLKWTQFINIFSVFVSGRGGFLIRFVWFVRIVLSFFFLVYLGCYLIIKVRWIVDLWEWEINWYLGIIFVTLSANWFFILCFGSRAVERMDEPGKIFGRISTILLTCLFLGPIFTSRLQHKTQNLKKFHTF
jgi:hypothetical protein